MMVVPRSRYVAFGLIAMSGFLLDTTTKRLVFDRLGMPLGPTLWVWEPYFGFQTSLNQGALFGIGQGKVLIFACLSMLAVVGICYWLFIARAAYDWLMTAALSLVMAGILGNLYDRLGLWAVPGEPGVRVHAVRDWILFQWNGWVWPNFNLADSMLVCGASLMVVHALWQGPATAATRPQSARQDA